MKNQKGVTLMILVVTIVIMAIIVGGISYSSIESFKMNAYYDMCTDIELLDEKIALYYIENKDLPIVTSNVKNIDELVPNYAEGNVNYNPNNSGTLYKIDLSKLENLSLKSTDYYMDETSHTIYSPRGIQVEEKTYYTVPLDYQKVDLNL